MGFYSKWLEKQKAKKLAKKKVVHKGELVPLGSTPGYQSGSFELKLTNKKGKTIWKDSMGNQLVDKGGNTYVGLYSSGDIQQLIGQQKDQMKKLMKSANQAVTVHVSPPDIPQEQFASMFASSTVYYATNISASATLGYGDGTYHSYYDAGVNNKKMVADLEAKVAELKAELDKKKLKEEALATTNGKRVVEI